MNAFTKRTTPHHTELLGMGYFKLYRFTREMLILNLLKPRLAERARPHKSGIVV
jgi:hypothetical protein